MNDFEQQIGFDFEEPALPDWAKRIVVFDTETTGLVLSDARIVTACVAEIDDAGNVVSSQTEWLADPGIEIPAAAANVHGVTTEIARAKGRNAKEVVAEILDAIRGYLAQGVPVVAYNAPYDFTILHYEALRHGLEPLALKGSSVIDPLVLDKDLEKFRKGKKLEEAARAYGVVLSDAHNATADAVAAGRLFQAMIRKYPAKFDRTLEQLFDIQVQLSESQDQSYANWKRNNGSPDFMPTLGWPVKLPN